MKVRFRIPGKSLAVLALVAALTALSVACDPDRPVIEATLVAPPGVPPALHRGPAHVVVHLEAMQKVAEIAPGVTYDTWSFNGTVPGPMIRVRVGDMVDIHLKNSTTSTVTHNIDLHAVNGPGGGAGATTVAPGEEKTFTFKALTSGLFVYHCAAGIVADHIANGMYGAILVEPAGGLDRVDKEFYIGQSDLYTTGDTGVKGKQELDTNKLLAENPTYVVFNGHTKSLIAENALQAKAGDRVRIFFADGGPNLISSFHVIGEIFDKAWNLGALGSAPLEGVQTILVPPGGATIVQFKIDVPGDYKIVDHSISRVSKGAVGTLSAGGAVDTSIFDASGVSAAAASSHDMGVATPAGGTAPTQASSSAPATSSGGVVKLTLKDNLFDPNEVILKPGEKVTFQLTNEGKAIHNMRIADSSGNFLTKEAVMSAPDFFAAGQKGTLEWTAPSTPGTYKFRCDVHPAEMTGTITVK
jgi:nitrite reductase (NO-forming)